MRILSAFPLLIALPLLCAFAWLGWELRDAAPSFMALKSVLIAPEPDGVVVGHRELLQRPGHRSAAERHLDVRFAEGQWSFANVAGDRRVDAPTDRARTRHLKRWRLADGNRILVGSVTIEVSRPSAEKLVLTAGDRQARWDGERLDPGGEVWVACPEDPHPLRRMLEPWMAADKERRLFSIGGAVDCTSRWAIEGIPSRGLVVISHLGDLWLAPGAIEREARLFRGSDEELTFEDLRRPLSGEDGTVRKLILGRTHYGVRAEDDGLRLSVITGADAWHPEQTEDAEALLEIKRQTARQPIESETEHHRWVGGGLSALAWTQRHWQWVAIGAGISLLVLLLVWMVQELLPHDRRDDARWWALQWPLPLFGIVLTVALWRTGDSDLGLLMAVAWAGWSATTLVLWLRGRLSGRAGLLWCCLLFLAGTGSLTLTQLAAGAENSRWLRPAILHLLVLSAAGWVAYWLAWFSRSTLHRLLVGVTLGGGGLGAVARLLLLGVVVATLVLQLPLGSEHGLFGVQPVEGAKLALVLVLAYLGMHVEELGFVGAQQYRESPLSLLWGLVMLLLGVLVVLFIPLVGVRDLSPVLLMAILLLAWGLHITPALPGGYRWGLRGLIIGLVALAVWIGMMVYVDPEVLPGALAEVVPEDRFRVWGQPWRFPHSGAQLLQALDLGSAGGLWGAANSWSGWTGWNLTDWDDLRIGQIGTLGWFGLNGSVMTLPEVHNDFIATFFIHHFGIVAAMILLGVQILVLALLFNTADRMRRWGMEGNREERQAGRVLALAILGYSWLLAGHWLIAWGNVLGVLPVMGQPMSWLAAANSHLLLFVIPGALLGLSCIWMLVDNGPGDGLHH
jgi:cell division protein FtsW (lipid II flippase)